MQPVIRQATCAVALIICLAACADIARADVKVRAKSTQGNTTSEQTTYIKGQRQRLEMAGGVMISITQCDLQRTLQIIPQTKTYTVTPFNQPTERAVSQPQSAQQPKAKADANVKGGVITTTITSKDTGERKPMFGYTARHIITQMTTESSPDACQKVKTRMEIDAWYIDAAFALDCNMNGAYQGYNRADQRGCQDRSEVKQVGAAAKGYPVWTKMTMFDDNGQPSFSYVMEVVEFSQGPLDASLFDAPAGYREVKDLSQAMSAGRDDATTSTRANENSGMNATAKNLANKPAEQPQALEPKKASVIRLGLTRVKTTSVGEGMNAAELAAAIRNSLAQSLKNPNVEVVMIEAASASQIDAEAKQKECDFIITASVEHKKGGSKFGQFAPALSHVASLGGYSGSTAGAVAGEVASAAIITAASASANVKAKDQLTLDINVQAPANAVAVAEKQFKTKAQSNGEDIISPTAQQAAQAILEATKK
ncbi:MAG: DUF4412 domain-containing protein [Blastocatellia bacterium]